MMFPRLSTFLLRYILLTTPAFQIADKCKQIATLTSMRVLIKASVLDPLDGSTKWKVNVAWDYARGIARSIKFDIEDFLVE